MTTPSRCLPSALSAISDSHRTAGRFWPEEFRSAQTADRCAALLIQFDGEIHAHGDAAKAGKAKKLRASGEKQCKSGHAEDGINSLTRALKNIGVKPRA